MKRKNFTDEGYEIVFESDNIIYIKMSELLIYEYLKMYNNQEIQKRLFKKIIVMNKF